MFDGPEADADTAYQHLHGLSSDSEDSDDLNQSSEVFDGGTTEPTFGGEADQSTNQFQDQFPDSADQFDEQFSVQVNSVADQFDEPSTDQSSENPDLSDKPLSQQRPVYGQDQRKRFEINNRIVPPSDGPIPVLDIHLHADEVERRAQALQVFPTVYVTWSQDQTFRPTRHDQFQFAGYIPVFFRSSSFFSLEKIPSRRR
ncbi:hypothetical protein AAVH_42122 [Aphelenchoides avenae]|nr:hypothetical protein AAVH_42122 [Aphelenchus avenae]